MNSHFGFSQTSADINSLLDKISEIGNSREIAKSKEAEKIINYGEKALPILADIFTNPEPTKIFSECNNRNLTKGEIAIIIADRIQGMPYNKLTGIENCLLTFCERNLNLIEYYLDAIERNGISDFQQKYKVWLESEERKEWTPLIDYSKLENSN